VGVTWSLALLSQLFANESVPDHAGYAKVKITLINENDNRPIFSQPLYNVSLYENVTVGTSVLTVLVSPAFSSQQAFRQTMEVFPRTLHSWGRGTPKHPEAAFVGILKCLDPSRMGLQGQAAV
jgi:hypothetical protein